MKRIIASFLMLLTITSISAQKKQKIDVDVVQDVHIDANLDEWFAWVDVANEGLWAYQLLQNKEYVFIAVRVYDALLQQMAARHGIVFCIPASKANKEVAQLIYPFPDGESRRALMQNPELHQDYKQQLIERSRGYAVQGFIGIPTGLLSLKNAYGIQAKAKIVDEAFVYEAAIPKAAIHMPKEGLILKIGINDGLSFVPKSSSRPGSGPSANKRIAAQTRPAKSKQTRMLLLETTMK
ncbi:hypothetical protein [Sphingobacterium paludis]|uniref:Uncharacterized protein n=1 Tax=Sphingobacterium paludis TaxID=1476465 RepID=A0A4R7CSP3_9SPHI|nr:hypothetical protein [Sphingobacterium paludis]TDS08451.1 hypothetical protein B0I21_11266 [Sphingobacterium paludis]